MWKVFMKAYPGLFWKLCPYYCLVTASSNSPMRKYIKMMSDPDMHWCGILSMSTNLIDSSGILEIGSMKNLAALEVNKLIRIDPTRGEWATRGGMTDGVVKTWIEMAKQQGTLQRLRVLKFRNQDRITPHILAYLSDLPELQLVITQNCEQFTGRSISHPRFTKDATRNDSSDPNVHGWIGRTLESIERTDGRGSQILAPLIHLYHDTPNQTWKSFRDMVPLRSLPFEDNIPVMEFQIPYNDREVYCYYNQRLRHRDVCCFVRRKDASTTSKRRRDTVTKGRQQAPRKALKERDPEGDMMAHMMADIMNCYK